MAGHVNNMNLHRLMMFRLGSTRSYIGSREARHLIFRCLVRTMSADEATNTPVPEQVAVASAETAAGVRPVAPRSKRAARPKIDLDDEIRRANDLAAASRKMLTAAKNVSRNTKRAKQRLIKKAGKLSPEDLERIAVLKRCGLFEEDGEEEADNAEGEQGSRRALKASSAEPSLAESKRPKLAKTLETLTASNPILDEVGLTGFGKSSSSAASGSGTGKVLSSEKKNSTVVLGPRARLLRSPSAPTAIQGMQAEEHSKA